MLKIFLCFFIVLGSGYIGFSVSLHYRKREKFWSDFFDFLNYTKSQISFFQNRLANIFKDFNCDSELKNVLIAKYKNFDSPESCELKKLSYLNDNEWNLINDFLDSIGKTDSSTECERIEAMIVKINEKRQFAKIELSKKGSASTKLGFACGLAISIILI